MTKNQYVSEDSFDFAKNVREQNPDLFMSSFDIDSLFTNVPLDETIDLCVKILFGRKKKYKGFSRDHLNASQPFGLGSFFLFNGTYYDNAMEWPWDPHLATPLRT